MHTWKHPTLGVFKFDDVGWAKDIAFPAFKPFRYHEFAKLKTRSKFTLLFDVKDHYDDTRPPEPTATAIRVADRVISNQQTLSSRILNAVWRDLHGRGLNTGMWWHGDLATIHEFIESTYGWGKPMPLVVKEDLFKLMGVSSISIHESIYGLDRPCAEICFHAAIDPEHGIGVLTDGTRVLGIGYQGDAHPFKKNTRKNR